MMISEIEKSGQSMEHVGLIAAVGVALISLATFLISRAKDAEERGMQKQRIIDLERRQDSIELKIDRIFDKLEQIHKSISSGSCKE